MNLHEQNKVNYDLLAKFFAKETTAQESAEVRSWANASAENQEQFSTLKFLWKDANALKNIGNESLPDVDVESALSKIKSRPSSNAAPIQPELKVVKSPNRFNFLRIAAGVALLIGAGWLAFSYLNTEPQSKQIYAANEIIEQPLADNSIVKLNKGATLTYPETFKENSREVELEGEAFFEVEHMPEKPFLVHAGEANVKVLGTSFNITSSANVDSTLVHVHTGKVLLYFEEEQVMLTKGMTGVFYKNTKKVAILEEKVTAHSFWANRNLSFKRTQLGEAVTELKSLYKKNIGFSNMALANCNLTVDFENKTIEEILDIIALTLDLEVVKTTDGFLLKGEGC